MKKVILLLCCLIIGSGSAFAFSDVSSYQWADSVNYLEDLGVVNGYEDGSFRPENKINRAEFVKMLMEGFYVGIDEEYYGRPCFSDLSGDEWYAKYACLAKEENILEGYPDGQFKGEKLITQPEALKIIFNTLEEQVPEVGEEWYEQYLNYAEGLGMYYFQADAPAAYELTRGEVAYFITWLSTDDLIDQLTTEEFYAHRYESGLLYYTDDPSECFYGESYDYIGHNCYLQCESEQECLSLEGRVLANLDEYFQDYSEEVESFSGEEQDLSRYDIVADEIVLSEDVAGLEGEALAWQKEKNIHQEIWDYFSRLIPVEERPQITRLVIFTDGLDGTMAIMEPNEGDESNWTLYVDPADSHPNGQLDEEEIAYTLVHEFAHLLTLNEDQVPADPIDSELSDEEYWEVFDQKAANCAPEYFPGEGCSKANSYINKFYQQFWTDIYDERDAIEYISNEDEYYAAVDAFYFQYRDRFVSEYAATNPAEDIAETFTYFVLEDKPGESDDIAEQKILFFYQYPELISLRNLIRARL